MKLNKNLLSLIALAFGIVGCVACGSASTNTVSIGNNGSTVIVVNKPSNATVENTNAKPSNAAVENSSVRPPNAAVDAKPSNTTIDAEPPVESNEAVKPAISKVEKIGVAECDEYLAKYEACINSKVPESQRAALIAPMETMRKGWKTAATNPQAKAALPGGCQIALKTAKQSMSQFSCDW